MLQPRLLQFERVTALAALATLLSLPGCTSEISVTPTPISQRTDTNYEDEDMTQSPSVDSQTTPVSATADKRPPIDRQAPPRASLETATFALG